MIEKLKQRRSIRKYTAEAIPEETLKTIRLHRRIFTPGNSL